MLLSCTKYSNICLLVRNAYFSFSKYSNLIPHHSDFKCQSWSIILWSSFWKKSNAIICQNSLCVKKKKLYLIIMYLKQFTIIDYANIFLSLLAFYWIHTKIFFKMMVLRCNLRNVMPRVEEGWLSAKNQCWEGIEQ